MQLIKNNLYKSIPFTSKSDDNIALIKRNYFDFASSYYIPDNE